MIDEIKDVLDDLLTNIPGVVGAILIDSDGIPISLSGRFDLPPDELGALLAACFGSYAQLGNDLGQELSTIITEYNNLKLYQIGMARGALVIIASKESYLGMIRIEARRAIGQLSNIMVATQNARKRLMDEHKLRAPSKEEIRDLITKFI